LRLLAANQFVEDVFVEEVKLCLVAKEAGLVDRQIFQQAGQFVLAFFADQQAVIAVERIQVAFFKTPLQAVLQEMRAPVVEVHAAFLVDEGLQKLEFCLGKLRGNCGCAHRFQFVLVS
jgi:hypothetical protein